MTSLSLKICQRKPFKVHEYSHLPNKRADPNKRAGRDIFFVYYMKKCCRGGLFFCLLHEKVLQGRIFFSKMLSEHACLLGR